MMSRDRTGVGDWEKKDEEEKVVVDTKTKPNGRGTDCADQVRARLHLECTFHSI